MEITTEQTLLSKIETALDGIRPYLMQDGGNVEIVGVTDDFTLELRMVGNCSDCHMSHQTMKAGVEKTVLKAVPEIRKVVALPLQIN